MEVEFEGAGERSGLEKAVLVAVRTEERDELLVPGVDERERLVVELELQLQRGRAEHEREQPVQLERHAEEVHEAREHLVRGGRIAVQQRHLVARAVARQHLRTCTRQIVCPQETT